MNRMMQTLAVALTLTSLTVGIAHAESVEGQIAEQILKRFPGAALEHIAPAPIPGLYEVSLGGDLIYVSADTRFALSGRLFDLENKADLTEPVLAGLRLNAIDGVPENKMIIFEPEGSTEHTITTFTDVDCPYCRKMHKEIGQLTDAGVRVRYLLFPRTAVGSPSYRKSVSVWCADDRNDAMTKAKSGEEPEARDCPNPVDEHMKLARRLGLKGTPMTITDSGEQLNGYVPADQLVAQLQSTKQAQAE